jgi:hypothetical protein
MSHIMKLSKRVIERRPRKEPRVTDNQFGFMIERLTMEAIYIYLYDTSDEVISDG